MPTTSPVPEGRRSKRIIAKKRASLVINLQRNQTRIPCLVVDSTEKGFRLHGHFHLRRGQMVELALDEDPLSAVPCIAAWVANPATNPHGEPCLEPASAL